MDRFTKREKEIVICLSDGLTYKQISEKLFITVDTVKSHINNIFDKLCLNEKHQVVAWYWKQRNITDDKVLNALKDLYEEYLGSVSECDTPCNKCNGSFGGCKIMNSRIILSKV